MNSLSWLIYAADVAGTIKGLSLVGLIASGISAGVAAAIEAHRPDPAAEWDEAMLDHRRYPTLYPKPPEGERPEKIGFRASALRWPLICAAASAVIMAFVPASGTLYAIAASEMGEEVLNSETGGKAVEALNAWLDRQIGKPAQ